MWIYKLTCSELLLSHPLSHCNGSQPLHCHWHWLLHFCVSDEMRQTACACVCVCVYVSVYECRHRCVGVGVVLGCAGGNSLPFLIPFIFDKIPRQPDHRDNQWKAPQETPAKSKPVGILCTKQAGRVHQSLCIYHAIQLSVSNWHFTEVIFTSS